MPEPRPAGTEAPENGDRVLSSGHENEMSMASADDCIDEGERAIAGQLRDFVLGQATRLTRLAGDAAKIWPEFL